MNTACKLPLHDCLVYCSGKEEGCCFRIITLRLLKCAIKSEGKKLLLFVKNPHKMFLLLERMVPWEWKSIDRKKIQHLQTMILQIVPNLISLFYYIQTHLIYIQFHFSDSQFYLVCIQYFDLCSLTFNKYIQSHLI